MKNTTGRSGWPASLPQLYRLFVQSEPEGIPAEGDYRDWGRIAAWVGSLTTVF